MKTTWIQTLLMLFIQLMFINTYAADGFKKGEQINVWAVDGLALKQAPGNSSENILIIPYGQSVTLISDSKPMLPKSLKITKFGLSYQLKGNWVRVLYQGKEGYVFDGYLSRMPPVTKDKNGMSDSDEDYLKRNYGITRMRKINGKDGVEKKTTYYNNGNRSIKTIFDGCIDTELYLKDITPQEGVLLLLQLVSSDDTVPLSDIKIIKLASRVKISYYFCD